MNAHKRQEHLHPNRLLSPLDDAMYGDERQLTRLYLSTSGKFATHARQFLAAGYRIIVPDLPSHGRSTGIHVYVPDMSKLADALYGVLSDVLLQDSKLVKKEDGSVSQRRKVFVAGQSLGGFCAALTCL